MTQTTLNFSLEEFLKDFKSDISKQFTELNQKTDKRFDDVSKQFAEVNQKIDKQFTEVNQKIDNQGKDITQLKVDMAEVKTTVDGMDKRLLRLENTLSVQIWALIIAVFGACAKYVFFPNFPNS
jgi:peptidoglycan hydrolase CwlO-like protein